MDSIHIKNLSVECDTTLYWPDTVLTISFTGMSGPNTSKAEFSMTPCSPNPVFYETEFSINLPKYGYIALYISDPLGRHIAGYNNYLGKGRHRFSLTPGREYYYIITAVYDGQLTTMKIINMCDNGSANCSLNYMWVESDDMYNKSWEERPDFCFELGHKLLMIGYAVGKESGLADDIYDDESYTFQFALNVPCPGMPEINYEGQVYQTVQIFSQCWLKENMNVGTMIPINTEMSNNGTIEKYCYLDQPDSCSKYGGLYQWPEAMKYSWKENSQGICPPGWHIPGDLDWKILEAVADSQYGIGDPVWDSMDARGFDAGLNLKSTSGWFMDGNGTDLFGFSALPSGYRAFNGLCQYASASGYWVSSKYTSGDISLNRDIFFYSDDITRQGGFFLNGIGVRCLKDD